MLLILFFEKNVTPSDLFIALTKKTIVNYTFSYDSNNKMG